MRQLRRPVVIGLSVVLSLSFMLFLLTVLASPQPAAARPLEGLEVSAPDNRIPLTGTLDGYNLSLTADINPTGDSVPYDLVEVNGKIYFGATELEDDYKLWVYDPASETVNLAAEIVPGPQSSYPGGMIAVGDKLYFAANALGLGYELWSYDTAAMTHTLVADINPDAASSYPDLYDAAVMDGKLYFPANDEANGSELWVHDPVLDSTTMITDINPTGDAFDYDSELIVFDNRLFFNATNGVDGQELWYHDPVSAMTVMVEDLNPTTGSEIQQLTIFAGRLYFRAFSPSIALGRELYYYEPGVPTITLAADFDPSWGMYPLDLTPIGDKLIFRGSYGPNDTEPFVYDPARGTIELIADIGPVFGGVNRGAHFQQLGGQVYFLADDGGTAYGRELWRYDPSLPPTATLAMDIVPGPAGLFDNISGGSLLTVYDDRLMMIGNDGSGEELWVYDPAVPTATLVYDFDPLGGSDPYFLGQFSNRLYYDLNDGQVGSELWILQRDNHPIFLPLLLKSSGGSDGGS